MFFATLFGSKSARNGAVIRRKVRDVERFIGSDVFCRELGRRCYSAVENAGQFVIFCKRGLARKVKTLSETESVPGDPVCLRLVDLGQQAVDGCFGVAIEHPRILFVEERVFDT